MPKGIYHHKPLSEEHKANISKAMKGKNCGEGNIAKREDVRKKISESLRGRTIPNSVRRNMNKDKICKPRTLEVRRKISSGQKGKLSYNWRGGVSPVNKRIRRGIKFRLWRDTVFVRDNWTCRKCSKKGYEIHPHHIYSFSNYPNLRFRTENGITLCKKCHKAFHRIYGNNNNHNQLSIYLSNKCLV